MRTLALCMLLLALAAADPAVFTTDVFVHGEGGYPCIRIPAVIKTSSGKILAFAECRKFTGDGCNPTNGDAPNLRQENVYNAHICMKSSTDSGRTWSGLSFPFGKEKRADDPEPVWDSVRNAVVLHVRLEDHLSQVISFDEGATWTSAEDISDVVDGYRALLPGPAAGIQKQFEPRKGRLLFIGHYGAYVKDLVWFSDDHGKTYKRSSFLFPGMDEAQLVELTNGTVMANLRTSHKFGTYRAVAVSHDGGDTWVQPWGDSRLTEPVCQASIIRDDQTNAIFFSNPSSTNKRWNMTIRRSDDDTVSWKYTFSLNPTHSAAYSGLTSVPEKGHIGLLWETNYTQCKGDSCAIRFTLLKNNLL